MGPIIELRSVETIYEGERIPVIKNIDLSVNEGEFISIIGPNGAGKTTLLETINGILPHTGGFGKVFGKDITKQGAAIRKDIGYVIQNIDIDPLSPFLSKDVVLSGRTGKIGLFRFPSKKDWDLVWESMVQVGMIDFAKRPVGKISGGELQKILFARALAQRPRILLLDEPLSNLDVTSRRQMEVLLNRIHEHEKTTIIMVSHDLHFIPSKCHRIIVLNKGTIAMDADKETVLSSKLVKDLLKHDEGLT
jgi:zinc/manganese transport system ATP-binding protein